MGWLRILARNARGLGERWSFARRVTDGLRRLHDGLAESRIAGRYRLCGGALLHLVRDGKLTHRDPDIDFYFADADRDAMRDGIDNLLRRGFRRLYRWTDNTGRVTEWSLIRDRIKYEFFALFPAGDRCRYYCYGGAPKEEIAYEIPRFETAVRRHFDRDWIVPSDTDAYLTVEYGQWRTPNHGFRYAVDSPAIVARTLWHGTHLWPAEEGA